MSVLQEPWAQLGTCDWAILMVKIGSEFQESNHILKMQTTLYDLKQRASVFKFNDQFRILILEVRSVMSGQYLLLACLHGSKPAAQTLVILASIADI